MDRALHDYADARNMMVDGQVRPNKVWDPRILEAMRTLPRERFVPPALRALAYADAPVTLGEGRALLEPMVIARLVQCATVRAGERALVVASGTGYGAALLAACGARVTALEQDTALLAIARDALAGNAGVTLVEGPLAEGWAAGAPYHLILIDGAVEEVPATIAAQVRAPGGRVVAILGGDGRVSRAVLGEMVPGGLSFAPVFDCAGRLLPMLARAPAFEF